MWPFRRKVQAATPQQERPRHSQTLHTPITSAAEHRTSLQNVPSCFSKNQQAAPPFLMTAEQARRLCWYIQTYRYTVLATMPETTERATTLRVMQAVQGKVSEILDRPASATITAPVSLLLAEEERLALKTMTLFLLSLYSRQAESVERLARLGDLAALKASLQRF